MCIKKIRATGAIAQQCSMFIGDIKKIKIKIIAQLRIQTKEGVTAEYNNRSSHVQVSSLISCSLTAIHLYGL